jgi:hypothetical protein
MLKQNDENIKSFVKGMSTFLTDVSGIKLEQAEGVFGARQYSSQGASS